jgi:hypothetical protein
VGVTRRGEAAVGLEYEGDMSDPALDLVYADMTAFRLMDQLSPCKCGHEQQCHDDDDCCGECDCNLFRDEER